MPKCSRNAPQIGQTSDLRRLGFRATASRHGRLCKNTTVQRFHQISTLYNAVVSARHPSATMLPICVLLSRNRMVTDSAVATESQRRNERHIRFHTSHNTPIFGTSNFSSIPCPGPYTCLRSVEHRSAAMLSFHLDRLWDSAEATGLGPTAKAEGRQSLERRTTEAIAKAMESFLKGKLERSYRHCTLFGSKFQSPSPPPA